MSKHEQKRAEKRSRLVQAGMDAFTETGYDNATVSDIVRRAGMTPSTFYNYFRDKEALRDEFLERLATDLQAGLDSIRDQSQTVESFVSGAYRSLFSGLVANQSLSLLLKKNQSHLRSALDHPALVPVFAALRSNIEYVAAANGASRIDADYATVMFAGAAMEVGIAMLARTPPDVDGAVSFVTAMLAGGIDRISALQTRD